MEVCLPGMRRVASLNVESARQLLKQLDPGSHRKVGNMRKTGTDVYSILARRKGPKTEGDVCGDYASLLAGYLNAGRPFEFAEARARELATSGLAGPTSKKAELAMKLIASEFQRIWEGDVADASA